VYNVAFAKQQLRQIGAVLPCDTGNQRHTFAHESPLIVCRFGSIAAIATVAPNDIFAARELPICLL
jgi:hypothetical protein